MSSVWIAWMRVCVRVHQYRDTVLCCECAGFKQLPNKTSSFGETCVTFATR